MSETDPYAPPEADVKPAVVEAAPVVAAEKAPDAPVTPKLTVPEGSIKTVLAWVGEDATRAQAALDEENKGEKRSSLITKLHAILN